MPPDEPPWVEEYRQNVGCDPPGWGKPTAAQRASAWGGLFLSLGAAIICGAILLVIILAVVLSLS